MQTILPSVTPVYTHTATQGHYPEEPNSHYFTPLLLSRCCLRTLLVAVLTLILLTWRIWWANNASRWQVGFNSEFKGLNANAINRQCQLWLDRLPTLVFTVAYARALLCHSFLAPLILYSAISFLFSLFQLVHWHVHLCAISLSPGETSP